MAGARGIEPRSKVLETFILADVLIPYDRNIVTENGQLYQCYVPLYTMLFGGTLTTSADNDVGVRT